MSDLDCLVPWLRAQLDADGQLALATTEHQPYDEWEATGGDGESDATRSGWQVMGIAYRAQRGPQNRAIMQHIAAHDPARVLRAVAAKRGMLNHYERIRRHGKGQGASDYALATGAVERSIMYAATEYSNCPGYKEEWRP